MADVEYVQGSKHMRSCEDCSEAQGTPISSGHKGVGTDDARLAYFRVLFLGHKFGSQLVRRRMRQARSCSGAKSGANGIRHVHI